MEDGPDEISASATLADNGDICNSVMMANFPDVEVEEQKPPEINGKNILEACSDENTDSSDCDALVIDEGIKPKAIIKPNNVNQANNVDSLLLSEFRGFEKNENNYTATELFNAIFKKKFNKYIFARDKFLQDFKDVSSSSSKPLQINESVKQKPLVPVVTLRSESKHQTRKRSDSKKPKLREYAQYLGLQPTVQFKCSKCSLSGFPSLTTLNEHLVQCKSSTPVQVQPVTTNTSTTPSTNIRVTRKVFLCSACGTYYENWNLFLHMREVHKRFICLYCLGMFSNSDKLSLHLISKHNCNPNNINTVEDFFDKYKDPCFLMCCDCQKVFTESDNFFNHNCPEGTISVHESKSKVVSKRGVSKHISGDTSIKHVTGDSLINADNSLNNSLEEMNELDNKKETQELVEIAENCQPTLVPMDTESNIDKSTCLVNDSKTNEINGQADALEISKMSNLTEIINEKDSVLFTEQLESNYEKKPKLELEESFDNFDCDISDDNQLKNTSPENTEKGETLELRKVPKVTLKLPKGISTYKTEDDENNFSDDSEKLTMEVDAAESDNDQPAENQLQEDESLYNDSYEDMKQVPIEPAIQIAGSDVTVIELELEQPLDKFESRILVQKCLQATIPTCIYCNHARKIAVNGKQLALHAIAEHRFSAIVKSITAEELIPESFVARFQESFDDLETTFFNLESAEDAITFSHVFECFQCRFTTTVHKELYLHNRKLHTKSILLCIMCKSNFYTYSELICHLCPGAYLVDVQNDIEFRCCLCVFSDRLPSAFRLMVHLRKKHHACDVCLELCHNQAKLSNHVWKHKLHHLCYRCAIAYRNKPDITKHLFWKHGTESVLCKRCLQKKWAHVYHFCTPPALFTCEECNLTFSRSVSLRVHKRIHTDEKKHCCTYDDCSERFISRKLLAKHEMKHKEPQEPIKVEKAADPPLEEVKAEEDQVDECAPTDSKEVADVKAEENVEGDETEKQAKPKKVDVYDLPALNLSESDTSDSEDETKPTATSATKDTEVPAPLMEPNLLLEESISDELKGELLPADKPVPILENIWDDFKNYQANKEKLDNNATSCEEIDSQADEPNLLTVILNDHDYCARTSDEMIEEKTDVDTSVDHDYCTQPLAEEVKATEIVAATSDDQASKKKATSPTKKKSRDSSSNSSSDSDSSSCTCGSNCSCSSSSNTSSSSSDSSDSDSSTSEGRRKQQQAKRERKKERAKNKAANSSKQQENENVDIITTATPLDVTGQAFEMPINESDLDTSESETDEEFYDRHPQKLASKLIEEKRNQLMLIAGIGPCINGSTLESSRPPTPNIPGTTINSITDGVKQKKKAKYKKRKKKKSAKYENISAQNESVADAHNAPTDYHHHQQQHQQYYHHHHHHHDRPVTPNVTVTIKNSPVATPTAFNSPIVVNNPVSSHNTPLTTPYATTDSDSSLRLSKRKRVPNRFYGYSSDEEAADKTLHAHAATPKWRKIETTVAAPRSPLVVPPITIKNILPNPPLPTSPLQLATPPPPPIEPIAIRTTSTPGELRVQPVNAPLKVQPLKLSHKLHLHQQEQQHLQNKHQPVAVPDDQDSDTDSNESGDGVEEKAAVLPPPKPMTLASKMPQPALYCYCRCPYDEVSEMIGCDSHDCAIEWFHFECVGIMVPPKGQWFCPDCRKKKQLKKEQLTQQQQHHHSQQQQPQII